MFSAVVELAKMMVRSRSVRMCQDPFLTMAAIAKLRHELVDTLRVFDTPHVVQNVRLTGPLSTDVYDQCFVKDSCGDSTQVSSLADVKFLNRDCGLDLEDKWKQAESGRAESPSRSVTHHARQDQSIKPFQLLILDGHPFGIRARTDAIRRYNRSLRHTDQFQSRSRAVGSPSNDPREDSARAAGVPLVTDVP